MSKFFDSNVLLYLIDKDGPKSAMASSLLAAGGTISVQVLNEFTDVAHRRFKLGKTDIASVLRIATKHCLVVPLDLTTREKAWEIFVATNIGIYDCTIVAAAELAGCNTLYTEDMADGQRIGGVTIQNPFK